jgi:hypothetical protein
VIIKLNSNNSIESTPKKSSTSGNPRMVKLASMNKHKRRSYKEYRGQGR